MIVSPSMTITDINPYESGEILLAVEKPSRYIGGEVNSVRKSDTAGFLRFALCLPRCL